MRAGQSGRPGRRRLLRTGLLRAVGLRARVPVLRERVRLLIRATDAIVGEGAAQDPPPSPALAMIATEAQDRETWKALRASLLAFVRARVENDATAEDIVQDVFLRGLVGRHELRDSDRFQAWLYRIARNAVIDHYRTRRPMADLPDNLAAEEPGAGVIEELAGCMLPCMARLPETYREAIQLSEIEGLTLRETGSRLGLSLSGAKSRVQRGRAKLLESMKACCAFERDSRGNVMGRTPLSPSGCTCGCDAD